MRYIINTEDEQGLIGIQISKWQKEKKIDLIEKGEPIIELKVHLEKVANALQLLKKAGYNKEVLVTYLKCKTGFGYREIEKLLEAQDSFYRAIGILK